MADLPPAFDTWFRGRNPQIALAGARAVIDLHEQGATVPFIARYRRDLTGNLDEAAIRRTFEARELWDLIQARQATILDTLERRRTSTPELRERILAALDPDVLEDVYLPHKPKRETKAQAAREAGLDGLAKWIWDCAHGTATPEPGQTLELWAFTFRNGEKGVADAAAAIAGAQELLVERLSEVAALRALVRAAVFDEGVLRSKKGPRAKPKSRYEPFFAFDDRVKALLDRRDVRYLTMRRGVGEGELVLTIGGPTGDEDLFTKLLPAFETEAWTVAESPGAEVLREAATVSLRDHVLPTIALEAHRVLKDASDAAAIRSFTDGVRRQLMAPPCGARPVGGLIPESPTSARFAVVDRGGGVVRTEHLRWDSDEEKEKTKATLETIYSESPPEVVAIAYVPSVREVEQFLTETLRARERVAVFSLVSDLAATAWSTSDAAEAELKDLPAPTRAAVFLARELQDPLSALAHVDARVVGTAAHQHEVSGRALRQGLQEVVESCVHSVGLDVNTAAEALLALVAGVGPALARSIIDHRRLSGPLRSRQALRQVGFSEKAFDQAAAFLRVIAGDQPLDATRIHPERYAAVEAAAARLGKPVSQLFGEGASALLGDGELRAAVGEHTSSDMVSELQHPGRDPRGPFEPFAFRPGVGALGGLTPNLVCPGIVTSVTTFGVFVDIGADQHGLVHVSELGQPPDHLVPGDHVQVRVVRVDLGKRQVSLSMRLTPPPRRHAPPKARTAEDQGVPVRRGKRPPPGRATAPAGPRLPQPADRPADKPAAPRPRSGDRPRPAARPPKPGPSARPAPRAPKPAVSAPGASAANRPAFNNPFAILADLNKKRE